MNFKHLDIVLILFGICSVSANSQVNCIVPLPPVLSSVSVQPETGKTEFSWIPSESTDIAGYIVYSYRGGDGQAIDTVWDPAATSHVISNTAPKYSSVSYVVAAHRLSVIPGKPGCTSPLSNVLTTIFCEAVLDTCNKKIELFWNSYPSVPKAVINYSVMLSVNGSEFSEEAVAGPDITSFTIDDFTTDAGYCFYIRANLEGNSFSTSNKACILTRMQRPPEWINADYASVNPATGIMLSFTIDPNSEIKQFLLERKSDLSETFSPLVQLKSVNGSVIYTDSQANTNIINYYRLSAINSCDKPVTFSNIASNIVLTMSRNGNELKLTWNKYMEWSGIVTEYRLFIDTGTGYDEEAVIAAGDTLYTLDYRNIMLEISSGALCMYVTAAEGSNPHGITGHSNSSLVCMDPLEVITVPNIFTPNNDLQNDLFKPVLSFTPTNYHLIISDQHGTVLFETRDYNESWNGTHNGNPQPEGICLWFIKVNTPSGKSISKTGTVTILRNP
jgi:gliding motility-associated-like protein